jgi:hypothetical protein
MGVLLLWYACLFWHGGVYRLQSTGETQSEAVTHQAEARNTTAAHGCSRGRTGTSLYLSGNVQAHAERVEQMHITSSADPRVIKNNYPGILNFCIVKKLCFTQSVSPRNMRI